MLSGLSGFAGAQFDFREPGALRKSYLLAAPYRSGSNYLCTLLWKTGVLGAPFGYFNFENEMRILYTRLGASSITDYVGKLIKKRTSSNGVFGLKAHFHHFANIHKQSPEMLDMLQPVHFIYLERQDKIAQAVSLAKGFQTRAWLSVGEERKTPLFYNREFIQACLDEVMEQENQWKTWLKERGTAALCIYYEDILRDEAQVVKKIEEFVGIAGDRADEVRLPSLRKQSDVVNSEWIARFKQECEPTLES
jgi:LPS sulfotransferase NodH